MLLLDERPLFKILILVLFELGLSGIVLCLQFFDLDRMGSTLVRCCLNF